MQYGAPCACRTRKQTPYNRTPVPGGPPAPGRRGSSDQSPKPSADLLKSQALQTTRHSGSDYLPTSNKYSTRQWRTFVLVAERLILPHQIVALRLHLLDVIVILGEGSVQFLLHGGSLLPGLHEFLFQCFRPEHCVAEALKHVGLLPGPLRDVLHRQHTSNGYSTLKD
jgi:hypothetical protein